jgi:hypothetical protein
VEASGGNVHSKMMIRWRTDYMAEEEEEEEIQCTEEWNPQPQITVNKTSIKIIISHTLVATKIKVLIKVMTK